jgi:Holliday junction resolvasome RuvABC DNA-binding subunit
MKNLPEFLILSRRKMLQARSLDYYLQTSEVQTLIEKATPEQKEQLYAHLEKGERELFISLVNKIRDSDIETMNVMALRQLARNLGVLDYQILVKERLLTYIKMRRDKNARKILEDERGIGQATSPPQQADGDGK